MKYMLDTNICSYIIKHKPPEVRQRFNSLTMDDCCMSSITLAELRYWVSRHRQLHEKSKNSGTPKINAQIIDDFIAHLPIADFDSGAADTYGEIRATLETKGILVGHADLLIGAHAISLGAILVTNNTKDFVNLPHIQLENWVS